MSDWRMSPLEMEVLMHCHVSLSFHPRYDNTEYKKAHDRLFSAGLLQKDSEGVFTTSVKGQAYVRRLLTTPLPVQKWVFEEDEE